MLQRAPDIGVGNGLEDARFLVGEVALNTQELIGIVVPECHPAHDVVRNPLSGAVVHDPLSKTEDQRRHKEEDGGDKDRFNNALFVQPAPT